MDNQHRKVICALDVADLDEALSVTRKLVDIVGAFKIGHALTLNHGLDVIPRLQDAGATRIFLDLKFHDIPNSVALAVREAAKRGVWMMTLHISGGPAMMTAAVEEANSTTDSEPPLLVGVSLLTSLDQHMLTDHLGVGRSIEDHMTYLSKLAVDCGLDGVVCSAHEVRSIRYAVGRHGIIVTPGIRLNNAEAHDQARVGDAATALADGADYLVIGRALISNPDPASAMRQFGFADLPPAAR